MTYPPSIAPRGRYRNVEKLICSEDTFAIISEAGDVFLWTMGSGDGATAIGPSSIKLQRVWLASRQLNAATVRHLINLEAFAQELVGRLPWSGWQHDRLYGFWTRLCSLQIH